MGFGDKHKKPPLPPARIIDGQKHELMMWLVVEARPDGLPVTLRLCQDQNTLAQELEAAGLWKPGDPDPKPTLHMLWTPTTLKAPERA